MAAGAAASLTQEAGLLSLCPTREPTSTRLAPPTRQVPPKWGERSARSRLRTSKREEVAHGISDCRQLASSISTSSTAPSNLGQTPECSFPPYLFPSRAPQKQFVATLARRAILARITRAADCKDCGGTRICQHNRRRSTCKDCGGTCICQHNRQRNKCKDCGGASICQHNRRRSDCNDCGGSSICQHNRRRSRCKDCGGASICPHNRRRSTCKPLQGLPILILFGNLRIKNKREYATRIDRLGCYTN